MLRLSLFMIMLIVSACDFNPEKAFDLLSGRKVNLVILANQPLRLNSEVTVFTSQEPMKVIGEMTSVCFSLRGGMPLQESKVMDQAFEAAMQNAKVIVVVVLASGDRVTLRQPLQAWSMHGKIIKNDELSACASAPCTADLPAGAQVTKVEVSSNPALQARGVYWKSERSRLDKPAPVTADTSTTKVRTSCAA